MRLPPTSAKAKVIVLLLLESFCVGISIGIYNEPLPAAEPAPLDLGCPRYGTSLCR